jgi:hypothetical protein
MVVSSAVHRVELVVARDLLDHALAVVLVHDEVADEIEEAPHVEDAAEEHLELAPRRRRERLSFDRAPGLEALAVRGQLAILLVAARLEHEVRLGARLAVPVQPGVEPLEPEAEALMVEVLDRGVGPAQAPLVVLTT